MGRQVSLILRMPLKRITPSFTVEHRQARWANSGGAKPGWAHAKLAPACLDEKANRIARSAFKTVAAHPPVDVIWPSIPPGRILPSLVEAAPVTGRPDVGGAQSRSYGGTAQAGHAARVPVDRRPANQVDEHVYAAEDLEPSIAVAAIVRLKRRPTSDPSAVKARTQGSEKRTRRPAEKQEKIDATPLMSADGCEPAPVSSASGLPPVAKPLLATRTSRILGRYVFRDELSPGESWKRRIEARRERRA
jgi:hypothetical protein